MKDRIKHLEEIIKKFEEMNHCEYDIYLSDEYLIIPTELIKKGIMDSSLDLASENEYLKKRIEKLEKLNNDLCSTILDRIQKKEEEEVEII